uniref:Uncharacterized protein n=1 Tax=Parascaris univalens TaxID=6257 RepID=A0A914ZP35_PARUN
PIECALRGTHPSNHCCLRSVYNSRALNINYPALTRRYTSDVRRKLNGLQARGIIADLYNFFSAMDCSCSDILRALRLCSVVCVLCASGYLLQDVLKSNDEDLNFSQTFRLVFGACLTFVSLIGILVIADFEYLQHLFTYLFTL